MGWSPSIEKLPYCKYQVCRYCFQSCYGYMGWCAGAWVQECKDSLVLSIGPPPPSNSFTIWMDTSAPVADMQQSSISMFRNPFAAEKRHSKSQTVSCMPFSTTVLTAGLSTLDLDDGNGPGGSKMSIESRTLRELTTPATTQASLFSNSSTLPPAAPPLFVGDSAGKLLKLWICNRGLHNL